MNKLLERAKNTNPHKNRRNRLTKDELELAVAWVYGEVNYKQVGVALNRAGSNVYNFLCLALRDYILSKKMK